MGSDFVSSTEAAKLLKRTVRTVVAYQQRGLLRRARVGKRVLIPKEDVENLAAEINANLPSISRKTFYQLFSRVQYLEATIAVLKKAAGLEDSPIRPEKEEAIGLFSAAGKALGAGVWSLEEIDMWAGMYEKLDEVSFDSISAYTDSRESWRTFYELCVAQTKQVARTPGFAVSIPLQQLHSRLCLSLNTLRRVVIAWVELNGGSVEISQTPSMDALRKSLKEKELSSMG